MTRPLTHQTRLIPIGVRLVMLALTSHSLALLWNSDIRLATCITMTFYLIGITLLAIQPLEEYLEYLSFLRQRARNQTGD